MRWRHSYLNPIFLIGFSLYNCSLSFDGSQNVSVEKYYSGVEFNPIISSLHSEVPICSYCKWALPHEISVDLHQMRICSSLHLTTSYTEEQPSRLKERISLKNQGSTNCTYDFFLWILCIVACHGWGRASTHCTPGCHRLVSFCVTEGILEFVFETLKLF